ncbi:UNVERIFIED_CONTAM: hypothetical protein HDU68_004033 [Siphonaria sp. JEL0065]|nr:hypothetical protein HDU68_004033 [Siphonaria sp. JEL0065]
MGVPTQTQKSTFMPSYRQSKIELDSQLLLIDAEKVINQSTAQIPTFALTRNDSIQSGVRWDAEDYRKSEEALSLQPMAPVSLRKSATINNKKKNSTSTGILSRPLSWRASKQSQQLLPIHLTPQQIEKDGNSRYGLDASKRSIQNVPTKASFDDRLNTDIKTLNTSVHIIHEAPSVAEETAQTTIPQQLAPPGLDGLKRSPSLTASGTKRAHGSIRRSKTSRLQNVVSMDPPDANKILNDSAADTTNKAPLTTESFVPTSIPNERSLTALPDTVVSEVPIVPTTNPTGSRGQTRWKQLRAAVLQSRDLISTIKVEDRNVHSKSSPDVVKRSEQVMPSNISKVSLPMSVKAVEPPPEFHMATSFFQRCVTAVFVLDSIFNSVTPQIPPKDKDLVHNGLRYELNDWIRFYLIEYGAIDLISVIPWLTTAA